MNGVTTRRDTVIHLTAGGMGGTAGAILTCPLEVVKTRLQSSNSGFKPPEAQAKIQAPPAAKSISSSSTSSSSSLKMKALSRNSSLQQISVSKNPVNKAANALFDRNHKTWRLAMRFSSTSATPNPLSKPPPMGVVECLRFIYRVEGPSGLFRGLGPNLVGVAPSRAIYFWSYSTAKKNVNGRVPVQSKDTPFVHVISAGIAGFCASSTTNPIWLVKTRLQLDRASGKRMLTVGNCVAQIYKQFGIRGFWKGVTASYYGISETVIHFVLYEWLKKNLDLYQKKTKKETDEKTFLDFAGFMLCGACSKTCATIVAYPHEVARTRLREDGTNYRNFWQTLATVFANEGRRGLYRGLTTQLVRQIPNTAVMMSTYELTVYCLSRYWKEEKAEVKVSETTAPPSECAPPPPVVSSKMKVGVASSSPSERVEEAIASKTSHTQLTQSE